VDPDLAAAHDASFESYVTTSGPALTRFAYLLVRDHHLAQDLVQEGLAHLHRHWVRVSDFADPDAYVRKIMLNQLLSWRRRRSWSERVTADLAEVAGTPAREVAGADRDTMWDLLGELPPQQRAVLVLRFYEDLDDDAIAALVGCAPATVRSHASKALARLRSVVTEPDLARGGRRD
jgi:RNA polymerase sigma-70 factor (sigma-E family)